MKYGGRGLRSGEEGFTMVELLVSILVSMIVLAAISAAFILQNKSYAKQEQVVNVQENARAALQLMTKELLMAGYDPAGLAKPGVVIGIMMADSDTVRFTMDLEGDTPGSVPDGYVDDSNEDITYALDTTENQVTRKSPNTGTAQPIGESIQSLSFKYFDSDDNELTGVPLSSSDMEEVTRVSVELEPLFPQALSFDVRGGGTYRDFIRLAHAGAAGVCEVAARVLSPSYAFAGPRPLKDSVKPPNLGKRGAKGDMANDETWDNDSSSSDTDSSSSSQCLFEERMPDMGKRCTMGFQPFQNEQGAILVIALIFVCILAISGTMAYQMTSNEFLIARNFDDSKEALNAGSAGIEEARVRLGLPVYDPPVVDPDEDAVYDPATSTSSPQYPNALWTAYILTSASWQTSDDPDYDPYDTNYFPTGGSSSDQSNTTITTNSPQSALDYWVKIRHKTDDASGDIVYYGFEDPSSSLTIKSFDTSSPTAYRPVNVITAYGIGENSGITIQAEVVHNPGPPILAALYAESDVDGDASSDDATLDLLDIQRNDNCSLSATTPDCSLCGAAPNRSDDIYLYSSDTTITPSIVTSNPPLAPDLSDMSDGINDINVGSVNINVNQGITSLKEWETSSTPSACYNSNYDICSSDVDFTVDGGTDGTGILLVEGNLTIEGSTSGTTWNGLILVTEQLTLNGGTGGITIEGAVLVNGQVQINAANQGPVTIKYNSCAIDVALSSIPLRVLSWEDRSITE